MRYEFDTEVAKGLPLDKLMAEEAILFELHALVKGLCLKKGEEMESKVKETTRKRQATKKRNGWNSKNVAERRRLAV